MYGNYSKLYASWCECYDPRKIELSILEKYCTLKNKDVLDIGCGTGRFMFRILPIVKSIIGIDNDVQSIEVLKQIMLEKYSCLSDKVFLYHNSIEECNIGRDIIDIAVFSWSFYALDKEQIEHALSNIAEMLREDGMLIILQPVGGEFEKIMRMFFEKHTDMDEYTTALNFMNEIVPVLYFQLGTDKIVSDFVVKDLEMLCNALKMFAITEGERNEDDLSK